MRPTSSANSPTWPGRRTARLDRRDRGVAERFARVGSLRRAHPHGPRICRTENVSACHAGIASLVAGALPDCAADALGEPVVAFKDKLNYKQPGGAGFSPHQELVAYPGVERVVSILVAIDDCRVESGCLWLAERRRRSAPGRRPRRRARRRRGGARLVRRPSCAAGDAVLHRRPRAALQRGEPRPTRPARARRELCARRARATTGRTTTRSASDRMRRDTERDGRFRISTLADFEGTEVATDAATDHCTHT